jgi:hypothetical protein
MVSILTASLNNNERNTNITVLMVYNTEHYYEQILVELLIGDATGPQAYRLQAEYKNLHAALRLGILALISAT